jgi:hypothetical protein
MSGRHPSKNLELSLSDIMRFKYVSITSVDVNGVIGGSQGVALVTSNIMCRLQKYYFATPENSIFIVYR